MKNLKLYEEFDKLKDLIQGNLFKKNNSDEFHKNRRINRLCHEYEIKNYKINGDGSIDVKGNCSLFNKNLFKIPIKFNVCSGGYFDIAHNYLETLENCPKKVDSFSCYDNNLKTLIGGPGIVSGHYWAYNNDLKDVYGFPEAYKGKGLTLEKNPVWEILSLGNFSGILIKFIKLINENRVIRNQDTVVQDRLEEALYGAGIKEFPEEYNFKNYKLI